MNSNFNVRKNFDFNLVSIAASLPRDDKSLRVSRHAPICALRYLSAETARSDAEELRHNACMELLRLLMRYDVGSEAEMRATAPNEAEATDSDNEAGSSVTVVLLGELH